MGTAETEIVYRCYDDCQQWGCPEHMLKATYSTTTESFAFLLDSRASSGPDEWIYLDRNSLEALLKAVNELRSLAR